VGPAGGHAHGNLRHFLLPVLPYAAIAALKIAPIKQDVDARHKTGHDDLSEWLSPLYVMVRQNPLDRVRANSTRLRPRQQVWKQALSFGFLGEFADNDHDLFLHRQ